MNEKTIKVVFVRYTKDLNSASFNRYIGIVKATATNFNTISVSNRPTINKNTHTENELFSKINVNHYYTKKDTRTNNFFRKSLDLIIGNIYALSLIKSLNKKEYSKVVVILYSTNFIDLFLFIFFKLILNYRLVTERNEYPLHIRKKVSAINYFINYALFYLLYKGFDGIILMTEPLISFYKKYLKSSCIVVKIPMTVDIDRFSNVNQKDKSSIEKNITYVGSLSQEKDGIDHLITAFTNIINIRKDLKLIIIGGDKEEIEKKRTLTKGFESDIIFMGKVDRELIPKYLYNSYILVLPRPNSKQAEGGFPTKLGEYLSTGIPTLLTNVGENSKYVKDNTHVFLVEPNNPKAYADKLDWILENYSQAKKIAMNGKMYIKENHSLAVEGKKLYNFLGNI